MKIYVKILMCLCVLFGGSLSFAKSTRTSCFKSFKALVGQTFSSSMPSKKNIVDKCLKAATANLSLCISAGYVAYGISPETEDNFCGLSSAKSQTVVCNKLQVSPTLLLKNGGAIVNNQDLISCLDNIKVKATILDAKQTITF
jgi:hypothetical protein